MSLRLSRGGGEDRRQEVGPIVNSVLDWGDGLSRRVGLTWRVFGQPQGDSLKVRIGHSQEASTPEEHLASGRYLECAQLAIRHMTTAALEDRLVPSSGTPPITFLGDYHPANPAWPQPAWYASYAAMLLGERYMVDSVSAYLFNASPQNYPHTSTMRRIGALAPSSSYYFLDAERVHLSDVAQDIDWDLQLLNGRTCIFSHTNYEDNGNARVINTLLDASQPVPTALNDMYKVMGTLYADAVTRGRAPNSEV